MNENILINHENIPCAVSRAMELLRGKWTFPIVHNLMSGKKRFKELERSVEGINTRMLVKELKALEQMGLVERNAFATVPPTVEYSLTPIGLALESVLNEIERWAVLHLK